MATVDKLTNFARSIGDKTSDALEITRLNGRISSERSRIEKQYTDIGKLVYEKYRTGEFSEEWVRNQLTEIDNSCQIIDQCTSEIERLKTPVVGVSATGSVFCPQCGAKCSDGAFFCGKCGGKL